MQEIKTILDVLSDGGLLSKHMSGYRQRDGQILMAEAIADAYATRKSVLINAPTGNGKSIGGLVPAILNKGFGPTIISTATKALQSQYAQKDLPMLHEAFRSVGMDFKSHVLKGRENYVCLSRFLSYLTDSGFKSDEDIQYYNDVLKPWMNKTTLGDFEELDSPIPSTLKSCVCSNDEMCDPKCKQDCFYKKNKALAQTADVIVVNHDLLALNFALRNKYGISILPSAYAVIIDEAHKFEDILTKYLGFKISKLTFRSLCSSVDAYLGRLRKLAQDEEPDRMDALVEDFHNMTKGIDSTATDFFLEFEPTDEDEYRLHSYMIDDVVVSLGSKLIHSLEHLSEVLPSATSIGVRDRKVIQLYSSIKRRCDDLCEKLDTIINMADYEDEVVFWVDSPKGVNTYINSAPISVAKYTSEWLFRRSTEDAYNQEYGFEEDDSSRSFEYGCVVLMSATLCTNKTFTFVKNRLGVSKYYYGTMTPCLTELIVPEVFDYRHQCLLYIPKGTVEPPTDNAYDKQVFTRLISQTLTSLADVVDGGILALFTSYTEMEKVYNMTSDAFKNRLTFNQKMYNRGKLTQMFRDNRDSVLYATSSFWEGVDIQGEALSCVVIDRLPFQVPSDPVIEARVDYIKRNGGDWFNDYYLPMAIIALQQGFGRLIRTKDDLGTVVLMDNRLLSKSYGRKILNSLPDCLKTRKLDKVELFFEVVRMKRKIRKRKKK